MIRLSVQVEKIINQGDSGAIFAARSVEPGSVRVLETIAAPAAALGGQQVLVGDVWSLDATEERFRGRKQFRAIAARICPPPSLHMRAFLMGGRFRGIGTARADLLLGTFGDRLRETLDQADHTALSSVLPPAIASELIDSWKKYNIGDLVEWLDQIGMPISLGKKISELYGTSAKDKLESDPYRLLAFGENWSTVDAVCLARFGVAKSDPRRIHAAIIQCLYEAWSDGDTALEAGALVRRTAKLTGLSDDRIELALRQPHQGWVTSADNLLQATGAQIIDRYIAQRLIEMVERTPRPDQRQSKKKNSVLADQLALGATLSILSAEQRAAVDVAASSGVAVVTGGAGVGKTTALRAICDTIEAAGDEVAQMALSGRATLRMADATGRPARTIASFLRQNPIDKIAECRSTRSRTIIVDEASMLDAPTLFQLLRRTSTQDRLLLIGDPMQLAPIGPGLPFHVLAQGQAGIPVARLTKVFRQDVRTGIPAVAASIRDGFMPQIPRFVGLCAGVSMIASDGENGAEIVARLYEEMAAHGEQEIRILATTRESRDCPEFGAIAINKDLYRRRLVGRKLVLVDGQWAGFCEGCPIMFTENDWPRELYNGMLGFIDRAFDSPSADGTVCIARLDGKQISLDAEDLKRIQRSFAITIHKAQGSQWRRVIIPISKSRLLDRSLVYTAITRGVEQVVLVGDIKALAQAVEAPPKAFNRSEALSSLLRQRELAPTISGICRTK